MMAVLENPQPGLAERLRLGVRSLRHRNFRLFFIGQLISLIGTWMQTLAESWLVYRLTGNALLLGAVGFASQIPVFLLSPVGGAVADRYDRQKVVIATQTAAMLLAGTFAFLTLTHRIHVAHVIVLAALLGIVNAFDIPARQSFIVEMVDKESMMNAIALNSSMFNGARAVGPAVAGLIVAMVGEGWCFFGNALSYIAVLIGLFMMRVPKRPRVVSGKSAAQEIAEGFRYVRDTAPVLALLLMLGVVSLVAMPYSVLMPIFADQILHSGARGMGILMTASGFGAMMAAIILAMRRSLKGLSLWIASAATSFGISLVLFATSRHMWLSVGLLVMVGFSMMLQMTSSNTLIQAMVPDRLRGRVMSVYSMMFMGMAPIGSLYAGAAAKVLGAPETVAIGGVVCAAAAMVFFHKLPVLRGEARRLILEQGMMGGEPAQQMTMPASVENAEEQMEAESALNRASE